MSSTGNPHYCRDLFLSLSDAENGALLEVVSQHYGAHTMPPTGITESALAVVGIIRRSIMLRGFYLFFHYPYPLLDKPSVWEGIHLASLLDIGLMKITAIASRGVKKDCVDLYYILQHVDPRHPFSRFSEKYPIERLDPYHYMRSLTYFADAETESDPNMLMPWSWTDTKAYFTRVIKEWPLLPERS